MGHEPIEFMPAFVPFYWVECISSKIKAAREVCTLSGLNMLRYPNHQIRKTVDHWKRENTRIELFQAILDYKPSESSITAHSGQFWYFCFTSVGIYDLNKEKFIEDSKEQF